MNRLVEQYRGPLLVFFNNRVQTPWDAEELTQEVFYKLYKCKFTETQQYPESYLFTVAWSVLRDRDRRDRVRHRDKHDFFDDVDEELLSEDSDSLEQVISAEQCYRRLIDGLNNLSPKARSIFLLNRYEGLTYSQIADEFSISVSAIEKHMMIAITKLKKAIKD